MLIFTNDLLKNRNSLNAYYLQIFISPFRSIQIHAIGAKIKKSKLKRSIYLSNFTRLIHEARLRIRSKDRYGITYNEICMSFCYTLHRIQWPIFLLRSWKDGWGQGNKKRKKKYEERGWEWREKLSNRSLDSLVSIAGPLRRGNAVTDNGTVLRRRSPMWEYCYSNDAAFLSVPLLSSFLLVLFLCHPASVKQHGCLLVAP